MPRLRARFVVGFVALIACSPALAQELSAFLGGVRTHDYPDAARSWMLSYANEFEPPFYGSVTYVNEGHFPGHHRDGMAAQLGLTTGQGLGDLALRIGAGPYRYFDTELAQKPEGYANAHGNGVIYTLQALWRRADSPWLYQLRLDRVEARPGPDTTMLLLGVGYRLEQDGSFASNAVPRGKGGRDELVVSMGQTIVNSFSSPRASASSVELRHAFGPVVRGSLAWLYEGDTRLIRRNGVVAQLWLEPTFLDGRLNAGVGYGPYVAVDAYHPEHRHNMGMLSTAIGWRLTPSWAVRVTWHRSVSSYDRDSDVFLGGIAYRF